MHKGPEHLESVVNGVQLLRGKIHKKIVQIQHEHRIRSQQINTKVNLPTRQVQTEHQI